MSQRTKIEWATHTWNPVTGCTKVSPGCKHCYAERIVGRFGVQIHGAVISHPDCTPSEAFTFSRVLLHHERLDEPLHWRKPRRVFVCSMSDLFHEDVPVTFLEEVLARITLCPQHTFMVLTKRADRLKLMTTDRLRISRTDRWPIRNLWLGVSVEDQRTADERIPLLLQTPAAVRFVSYEPALGPVDFEHAIYGAGRMAESEGWGIDWLICGGESGPGARPMHPDWARSARDQCQAAGVPFFFKQFGEWRPGIPGADSYGKGRRHDWPDGTCSWRVGKRRAGRLLDGREWDEAPEVKP